jgi:hypothetical protein
MVKAAIDLLEVDGYRKRLGGDPLLAIGHRKAVERTLTASELAVVDRVLADQLRGCVAGILAKEVGGDAPDTDDELDALTAILGREPRRGR